jgi:hypothetical protein
MYLNLAHKWEIVCRRHPSLSTLGCPADIALSEGNIHLLWGSNGYGVSVSYLMYYSWDCGPPLEDGLAWEREDFGVFVSCEQPTHVEICKQLRKRGMQVTPLTGALSLCDTTSGRLSLATNTLE